MLKNLLRDCIFSDFVLTIQGNVESALQKELLITPFTEHLLINLISATNIFLRSFIFVGFLFLEGYAQVAIRKELILNLFLTGTF